MDGDAPPPPPPGPARVRVEFEDRHLLTKSQRSEGLRRCWLLLRPHFSTVSDLSDHLVRAFGLRRSCSDGFFLSMDGYVLPPFESIRIFRDKDLVRVIKKVVKQKQLLEVHNVTNHNLDSEIVEKETLLSRDQHLAIKNSHKSLEVYKRKSGEDNCVVKEYAVNGTTSLNEEANLKRKRELSDKPGSSKRKKLKPTNPEKTITPCDQEENSHSKQNKSHPQKAKHGRDGKSNVGDKKIDKLGASHVDANKKSRSVTVERSNDQVQENSYQVSCEHHASGSTKKFPSRSTRRKKAKRQWRKEMANEIVKESQMQESDMQGALQNHVIEGDKTEMEEEIVPVIVRPGHIRFESIDGEHDHLQPNGPTETLQWNGITSKKKGQKWGREKTPSRKNEDTVCNGVIHEELLSEERKQVDNHDINFESLSLLTRLPMEGDVVAYRVVELSSSWCPELSCFRVGKVSSYDAISLRIVLLPVPECPTHINEKDAEESAEQRVTSIYQEDGSLEIEYPSLVDVRLLKASGLETTTTNNVDKGSTKEPDNWDLPLAGTDAKESPTAPAETNPNEGWAQIDQALNEKKAQLQNNIGWGAWTPNKSTWSYRAVALGPTVAFLRGKDHNYTNSSSKKASSRKNASSGKS